mmetsp:Transcript_6094/g.9201  ORF Transcript_6094/g.9201 Transcript_6094/m.9201 type:complete len:223 (+) Transcript_6094:55-723(+)
MSTCVFTKPCVDQEIKSLSVSDPYNFISGLEGYVNEQISNTTYDFIANKSLLKLYQCYPELQSIDKIAQVLVLSLMRLPSTDYLALSCLVPGRLMASNQNLKAIQTCSDLLESGKFPEVWDHIRSCPDAFNVKSFNDRIRAFILGNMCLTFRNTKVEQFCQMLSLSESEVMQLSASCPGQFEVKSGVVTFHSTETHGAGNKFEGSLRLDEILRLMKTVKTIE